MHLSNLCCSLRSAPANPNVALRNARSLPSCLEDNFGYKFCKRGDDDDDDDNDAAEGIFGDERPLSPWAGSAHDFPALCFCDDKARRDERKKNYTRDGPRAVTRQDVNSVWEQKASKDLKSIDISVRSCRIRQNVWSIRLFCCCCCCCQRRCFDHGGRPEAGRGPQRPSLRQHLRPFILSSPQRTRLSRHIKLG